MYHEDFAKQAVGTVWEVESPWEPYMPLFLVLDVSYENDWLELKVMNLYTGEIKPCPFDSGQRRGPNHWAIFYPFEYRGLWSLIRREDL